MRLIDANELEKKLCEDCIGDRVCERRCYEVTMIRGMPTVDAVKHGHWINKGFEPTRCSVCRITVDAINGIPWAIKSFKYCPNCGAKMDEVKE